MSEKVVLPTLDTEAGRAFLWEYLLQTQSRQSKGLDRELLGFFAHCLEALGRSKAQLFQDIYVEWKLRGKRGGYFVEFGATNGVDLSNTWYLENSLGWSGILAEPLPAWHAQLHAARTAAIDHRCVWWKTGDRLEFAAPADAPEFSTIAEFASEDFNAQRRAGAAMIEVETVALTDLLAEHGAPPEIDYLSIDTEGSELDILSAFDFERYRLSIITVEHNFRTDVRAAIHQLLTAHGFVRELESLSFFDDWYFHPARIPQA